MQMTWKKGVGAAVIVFVIAYGISVWWSIEPEVLTPKVMTSEKGEKITGYATTSALIETMETLLDKQGAGCPTT